MDIRSYTTSNVAIDLGCGRCEWLEISKQYSIDITGVDTDDWIVNQALSSGYKVKKQDAVSYLKKTAPESISLITAFHIIEHLEFDYLIELLCQAHRCLTPGGIIIIETPNPENLYTASVGFNLDPTHRKPLPPELLSFVVTEAGFERTNILRLNESRINQAKATLVDVIYNVSPDFSVIAQKKGRSNSSKIDSFFSANAGLSLNKLAHNYDENIQELVGGLGDLHDKIHELNKSVQEISENIQNLCEETVETRADLGRLHNKLTELRQDFSSLYGTAKAQEEWVLSFSQKHANHISLHNDRLKIIETRLNQIELHPLLNFKSLVRNKIIGLYHFIQYFIDRRRVIDTTTHLIAEDPAVSSLTRDRNIKYAEHSTLVNLAYIRIAQAVNFINAKNKDLKSIHSNKLDSDLPLMALVTPFPPHKTGIANYSAELLTKLQEFYRVTVIIEAPINSNQSDINNIIDIRDHCWFEKNAYMFDRVIYQFGNSIYHAYMLDLLEKFPGIVVLHDFYLGHLIAALDQKKMLQGIWADELYRSEGYNSLIKRFKESKINESVIRYPVNSTVVHRAQGIILHNNYSLHLARHFFGEETLNHFAVVPLGKTIYSINNKENARNHLGIPQNAIVICSFGFLGPNKCSQDIFDAWKHVFTAESNVYLYFVGEKTSEVYCSNLQSSIDICDNNKACITGYVDSNIYENYLYACDIAIQLRVNSRGETSAALLDCMGAGLATIVLNHGPFAELPDDCVYKIEEDLSVTEISAALSLLANNSNLRSDLGNNAKRYIETEHNFTEIIKKYVSEIERFSINAQGIARPEAIYSLAKKLVDEKAGEKQFLLASIELANSFKVSYSKPQLLIDISALIKEDLNSGIQRYTKSQLLELFNNPPVNTRVEPIYLDEIDGRCFFRYANNFTLRLLGISDILLPDAPVIYGSNDIYYMPDLCYWSVQKCEEKKIYSELKALGIKLYFVAFDILPITIPDFFPPGATSLHTKWLISILRNAAGIICISQVTKNEILLWIERERPNSFEEANLYVLHLGYDFNYSKNDKKIKNQSEIDLLRIIQSKITFILVGTVEPRKGHLEVLNAFEELWKQRKDIILLIVGKEGWKKVRDGERKTIPEIIHRLNTHGERGSRLFWVSNASDNLLEKLYKSANCLIMASIGEGFGLPLVEAAQNRLPIIARDIPVFREVLGDNAVFFSNTEENSLAKAIEMWISSYDQGDINAGFDIPVFSWKQNVDKLKIFLSLD